MYLNFIILFLLFSLFIGLFFFGLNYYSNGKVYGDERKKRIGKKIILIPFIIFISFILLFFIYNKISFKPSDNDLIGKYEISVVSNIKIDKNDFEKCKLVLMKNGEFYVENKPNIDICENGKYNLYNSEDEIRINFNCSNNNALATIISNLSSFKIEFIIGDPDSSESISFKKIEN